LRDKDGNKIGLMVVDQNGNASPNSITRAATPRTALKTTTGSTYYSDFEPPWSPIAQEDWSGGRGQADYEDDTTRFYDSKRANTFHTGMIINGPLEVWGTGIRNAENNLPGGLTWQALLSGTKYIACLFEASGNYDVDYIYIYVRRRGTPVGSLTVSLCSNNAGDPGSELKSVSINTDDITDYLSEFYQFAIDTQTLVSGTNYFVKVAYADGDGENHYQVGVNVASGNTKQSSDGSSWTSSTFDLYYRVTDDDSDYDKTSIFFQFKRLLYCVLSTVPGTAPKLYKNGDRGVADANTGALDTLVDAAQSWTTDEWVGCTVLIIAGKGSVEEKPYRTILSNTDTALTVDGDWIIEHDTTTEYVILGSNKWTEITGHGLTSKVTDVLTINDSDTGDGTVYFAQGEDVNIRRWRWHNSAGTATNQFDDDSTNKATFLCTTIDGTNGIQIWRANNGSPPSVSKASVVDWGINLTFGSAINLKSPYGFITNIEAYGESSYLWIFREGSIFSMDPTKTIPAEINLKEIRSMFEPNNGKVVLQHNAYLYFNMIYGLERYYNSQMDDIGPNRDEGLPSDRKAVISAMVGYPGQLIIALDGGDDGYSSIMTGGGGSSWHELYRAPAPGLRIRSMNFQAIPGDNPNRLWFSQGADLMWLYFPLGPEIPYNDSSYRYTHESMVETSWQHAGLSEVYKLYHSLKLFTEGLSEDEQVIEVYYKADTETAWTKIEDEFHTSPVQERDFTDEEKEEYGIDGKRLKYRLVIQTSDNCCSPKLKTAVVECVSRVPVKYSYTFNYRVMDNDVGVSEPDTATVKQKQEQLDAWAENLTPIYMNSLHGRMDKVTGFIDPASIYPFKETKEGYTGKLVITEI
jgi:hypothetical protein